MAIDVYAAARAAADLVVELEVGVPPTTIGACLGGSRLNALEYIPPRIPRRSEGEATTKEEMAPCVHGAGQLGPEAASVLGSQARSRQDGRDDDLVAPKEEVSRVVVSRFHMPAETPTFPSQLLAQRTR